MSRFFKSAAFPILIVVVLAFFAQKLISPGTREHVPNYSEFVGQVDSGQVKDVTLQTKDNTLDVELKNGRRYQSAYPDNTEPQLIQELQADGFNLESIRRLLGTVGLPEVDRDAENDHRHDDERIDVLSERSSNRARHEQDHDQGIREEVEQLYDSGKAAHRGRLVWAVHGQAPRGLGAGEPLLSARH